MLPRYNNNVATLQQQYCHATTTILPRYDNNIATLRQQYCHATTILPRYNNVATLRQYCHATTTMSRNGQKMS
ncbi:hypothetical protein [Leyella stercorea]|uniref:hypothetical protein n=1 Tax=Leyella stercorea TaxID=363265 RepID=UPI003F7CE5B8